MSQTWITMSFLVVSVTGWGCDGSADPSLAEEPVVQQEAAQKESRPPARYESFLAITDAQGHYPVLSVHVEDIGWEFHVGVRLAIWADGTVVWNEDCVGATRDHLKGRLSEQEVRSTLDRVCSMIAESNREGGLLVGLHAKNSFLFVDDGGDCQAMLSTYYENEHATPEGANELLWARVWQVLRAVIPEDGDPCAEGDFCMPFADSSSPR